MRKILIVGLVFLMGFVFFGVNSYANTQAKTGESRFSYGFSFYAGLQNLMGKESDYFGGSCMAVGFKNFLKPEIFWGTDFNTVFYNWDRGDNIDMGVGADLDVKLGAFFFKDFYTVVGSGIAVGEYARARIYPLCGIGYEFAGKKDQAGFCVEVGMKGKAVCFTASIVM